MVVKYVCSVCCYVYEGDIPFEDLPDDWSCPVCGEEKSMFERVEE
jgi:rubredoxin